MPDINMKPRSFGFFLAPKFSMMTLLSMTEPLRAANEIAGQEVYRIRYFAESAETTAINGMKISTDPDQPKSTAFDAVIVCASYEPERAATKKTFSWLRWLSAHGVPLGSADTGAYILAQAGLLSGEIITLHWVNLPAFREMFPDVATSSRLVEFSEKRFSCAGATTGIDMILHLLGEHHGEEFKARVANHFIHRPEKDRAEREQSAFSDAINRIQEPLVRDVLHTMERSGPEKISIADAARSAGLTVKQLERRFKQALNDTPSRVYQRVRLEKARGLLNHTSLSVEEVAIACGFASRSQFSRIYKKSFNISPAADRRLARI